MKIRYFTSGKKRFICEINFIVIIRGINPALPQNQREMKASLWLNLEKINKLFVDHSIYGSFWDSSVEKIWAFESPQELPSTVCLISL